MSDALKPSAFIAASAAVMLFLGTVHLVHTIAGIKLHPRDPDLTSKMMSVAPVISSQTTMWRAWIGFNFSHSLCLTLFGSVYGYLSLRHSSFLLQSWFLLVAGLILLLSFASLARVYWFNVPFRGVLLALILYAVGLVLNLA